MHTTFAQFGIEETVRPAVGLPASDPAPPAGAFEAVLSAVAASPPTREALQAAAPRASEVFEAPSADPQRHRTDAMKSEARLADLRGGADLRSADPRGATLPVEARPAASPGGEPDVAPLPAPGSATGRASLGGGSMPPASDAPLPAPSLPPADAESNAAASIHAPGSRRPMDPAGRSESPPQPSSAVAALNAAPAADAVPSAANAASAARQIAEWLADSGAATSAAGKPTSAGPVVGSHSAAARAASGPSPRPSLAGHTASAPAPQESARASPFDKLVRRVRIQREGERSTATLDLDPPELGRIRVEASMEAGRLELSIHAQTAAARQAIGERLAELRQALEQHGVHVGAFQIESLAASESAALLLGAGTDRTDRGPSERSILGEVEVDSDAAAGVDEPGEPAWAPDAAAASIAAGRLDIRV